MSHLSSYYIGTDCLIGLDATDTGQGLMLQSTDELSPEYETSRGYAPGYTVPAAAPAAEGRLPLGTVIPKVQGGKTYNSNSGIVRVVQQRLLDLGYSLGRTGVDGKHGKDTAAAIKQFQRLVPGMTPSGNIDDALIAALGTQGDVSAVREKSAKPAPSAPPAPSSGGGVDISKLGKPTEGAGGGWSFGQYAIVGALSLTAIAGIGLVVAGLRKNKKSTMPFYGESVSAVV